MFAFLKQCLSAFCIGVLLLLIVPVASAQATAPAPGVDGLVKVRSPYSVDETVARLKKDIADKGIVFFQAVDQARLAADAGIALRPSTVRSR